MRTLPRDSFDLSESARAKQDAEFEAELAKISAGWPEPEALDVPLARFGQGREKVWTPESVTPSA